MEAKDTVISPKVNWIAFNQANLKELLLKQAEISFKVGRELGYQQGLAMKPNPDGVFENGKHAGIKEVVDWIQDNYQLDVLFRVPIFSINKEDWNNKLREWGISS